MSENKGFFEQVKDSPEARGSNYAIGLGLAALADAILVVGSLFAKNQRETLEIARRITGDE